MRLFLGYCCLSLVIVVAEILEDYQDMQSNQRQLIPVVIGSIFGDGDEKGDVFAAYKLITTNCEQMKSEKYSFNFKTVFVEDISNSFQISGAICQLLVDGVVAIIGPIHPRSMNTIRSLSNYYDILYLTISDPHLYAGESDLNKKADKIIKLNPTVSDLLADFIYELRWSRMLYVYDSDDAIYRLRMLFELTNSHNYELSADIRMIPLKNSPNLIGYIDNQSKSHTKKQVVLDLERSESIKDALCHLKDIINNRVDYHFLFTNIDFMELNHSDLIYGRINVTTFSLIDYSNPIVLNFIKKYWNNNIYLSRFNKTFSSSKGHSSEMLSANAALIVDGIAVLRKVIELAGPHHEPTQSSSDEPCTPETVPKWRAANLLPVFHKISHSGLTGNISFNTSGFRQGFSYNIHEARVKNNLIKIGNWTQGRGFQWEEKKTQQLTSNIRFENKTRIVTSILVHPFLFKVKEKGQYRYEGFCYDLIMEIAKEVNFSFIIKEVDDGVYGSLVNGSWNGMIGELIDEKADLAVAPLTITSSRERVVDFSTPFKEFGLSVMFLKSHAKEPEIFGFMKPLSNDIWMCIAYAYLGVSVVLFMVSRFNPIEWNEANLNSNCFNENDSSVSSEFSIFNSFWFSLSAFMQQGGDVSPRSLSGRIVGGVWWFFTLIIVSSYTANLAAYLTVERMSNPIKSYEDLAKQNKIKYGLVDSGSSKEFFSKSKIDVFKKMWQFMEANPEVFVKNISMGYQKVKSSNREYAFILESSMNDYYNLQDECVTTKIGPNLDSGKGYGIATPPGSILRDPINLAVLKLKERNRIPELVQKWWNSKSPCSAQKESTENSITKNSVKFNDIRGLFILLLVGIGVGIFLSILELIYTCALESRRKKKSFIEIFKEISDNSRQIHRDDNNTSFKSNSNSRVMFAI